MYNLTLISCFILSTGSRLGSGVSRYKNGKKNGGKKKKSGGDYRK
jgi:hypothetical protein